MALVIQRRWSKVIGTDERGAGGTTLAFIDVTFDDVTGVVDHVTMTTDISSTSDLIVTLVVGTRTLPQQTVTPGSTDTVNAQGQGFNVHDHYQATITYAGASGTFDTAF